MNEKKMILVVEDDLSIRETIKDALESEGYAVMTAVNGKEGLEKIRVLPPPALVLLDMMMPVMNGREFLNVVLADLALAPIPVIVISAETNAAHHQGAVAFMKKPADLHILLEWVEKYAG